MRNARSATTELTYFPRILLSSFSILRHFSDFFLCPRDDSDAVKLSRDLPLIGRFLGDGHLLAPVRCLITIFCLAFAANLIKTDIYLSRQFDSFLAMKRFRLMKTGTRTVV